MSTFMEDVARATLPVAIALLIFAATARAVLWARIDDAQAQRLAGQYAEPLATWCVVAVATHVLALGAAGEAGALSLALPLCLGAVAMVLRSEGEAEGPAAAAPPKERAAANAASASSPSAAPAPAPAPAPAGSLWAGPVDDDSPRHGRLWSR